MPIIYEYGGHPAPDGASPTQPYKCGQYVKIKVKTKTALILTLILTFNILTAFIRLGRARPAGAGCPPYL